MSTATASHGPETGLESADSNENPNQPNPRVNCLKSFYFLWLERFSCSVTDLREFTLEPEEDAFGQMLMAYYEGRDVSEIVERDDGLTNIIFAKGYFSGYEDWHPIEQKAMQFVKGRVLDIGCGAGRHSLYLQEKGFDVFGIDASPLAIKVCKLRGLKQAKVMSIEDLDFKQNSFDTIIMMGNNFGLFGSFSKARELLKKFYGMTSENALVIAETRDPYKTDDPNHSAYHRLNKRKGRMGGQLRIRIRFQNYVSGWFDYLMVSKQEITEMLEGTGWTIREFIDSEVSKYVTIIEKMSA
ncbi:MAG TPA: class I SAM-dependent methyltransferase [Candidatus Bathyarchaeota archaeon]|nr:class I SAM-dependent methyltransferase [Candidatus Bathyarchaeota archaeon]